MADSTASARRRRPEPAGRGTLRDEQRRLTRRRLAEAALELFEQVGYASATADGIAKRAGANRATFYLHYGGKADVVLELMDGMHDAVIATVAPVGALEDPTFDDVRGWLARVLSFFEANRALVDAHHQAIPVEPNVARRWWEGLEQMVDAVPRLWEHLSGEERERARIQLVSRLVGLERMCWFVVIGHAPVDRDLVLDGMADDWLALLRGV